MFISIVEMYPHFRFRYLGHLAQRRIYESVGENSSRIWRVESETFNNAQLRGKTGENWRRENVYTFSFFISFFFFF